MTTRRDFLQYAMGSGGSLMLFSVLPGCGPKPLLEDAVAKGEVFKSLYLEVMADNRFFLSFDKAEMGQGVITGQATLFGEEADIHPATFNMVPAGADARYGTAMGHMITGGSTSTPDRFQTLRLVAAAYRRRVIRAAAAQWQLPLGEIETLDGVVFHKKSGKKAPYAKFNKAIASFEAEDEEEVVLKPKEKWRYIGKFNDSLDARDKATGTNEFGVDFHLEGMKTAIVIRPPAYKGKLKSYKKKAIKSLGPIKDMFPISSGLAIVCDSYWQCLKVKKSLTKDMFTWDNEDASLHNSKDLKVQYQKAVEDDPLEPEEGQKRVSAQYSLPFLCHAPMEPQNGAGWKRKNRLDFWLPTQGPTFVKAYAAQNSSFDEDDIFVHNSKYLGGGFGRRGQLDYAIEVIELTLKVDYPIKLMWSREDDMQHSPLRPMSVHRLEALVTRGAKREEAEEGSATVQEWRHKMAAESIMQEMAHDMFPLLMPKFASKMIGGMMDLAGVNPMAEEGAKQPYDLPYDIESIEQESSVPVTFWRSVGSSHNGFVVESFVDEVADALGEDPYSFRMKHLQKAPRAAACLRQAAKMAGWSSYGKKKGRALGIGYHFSFNTHCAQICEVEVKDGSFRVLKVYAAVDCGIVLNPDIVKKQVASGIIYGLSAALHGKIEFKDGAILQSNFHDYPMLRLSETPDIEVSILPSGKMATGIGEPGLPPIAGAVANALFRATGKRYRDLPFVLS